MLLASLHLETRSGVLSRSGSIAQPALRVARAVIRQRGFTILQAYAAAHGVALPGILCTASARRAWRAAETAAMSVWEKTAPAGCPRPPNIRLTVAVRRRPGA